MSSSFSLLSPTMQQTIWKMGWTTFTDVQDKAIPAVLQGSGDVLLASETASGKTEAAFLPILTMIEANAGTDLKVIYVSPLKALINDQFERIEELCALTGIPVHRWHGDVAKTVKDKLVKRPAGILQITPESLESLCINRPGVLANLLKSVSFIVIDEIHTFLGSERGTHLRSLLGRLMYYMATRPRLVGLSATVGDYGYAARWLSPSAPDDVMVITGAPSGKQTLYSLLYQPIDDSGKLPVELLEDIREVTRPHHSLIFCNRKAEVEEVCHFLNRLAQREGVGEVYLPHHASLAAAEREYAERVIREAATPRSLVSTSTLELGISIGQIDLVVQLNSTYSVASLKQRLGRSGRKGNDPRMFQLYATSESGLVQSIAVTELFLSDWVESPHDYSVPYDILWHQVVSLCSQFNGLLVQALRQHLDATGVFAAIPAEQRDALIQDMVRRDFLEQVPGSGELIVGVEGERILRSRDFYAVFQTPEEYQVIHKGTTIGTLPVTPACQPDVHIILAGRLWRIAEVDSKRLKLYVEKATAAQRPTFFGTKPVVDHQVRTMMAEVVQGDRTVPYLYGDGQLTLAGLRQEYRHLGVTSTQRVAVAKDGGVEIRAFAGDVILSTLELMLREEDDVRPEIDADWGWIFLPRRSPTQALALIERISSQHYTADLLVQSCRTNLAVTKFGQYLPVWAQQAMHAASRIDVAATRQFLTETRWVIHD